MKQNTWFDYHFGGWLWLIRYKIANFVIGYNIEDALEEHMANGWEECAQEAYDRGMLHDITFEDIQTLNPYSWSYSPQPVPRREQVSTCTLEFDGKGNKVRDVTVAYVVEKPKPRPSDVFRGWWEDWGEDSEYDLEGENK